MIRLFALVMSAVLCIAFIFQAAAQFSSKRTLLSGIKRQGVTTTVACDVGPSYTGTIPAAATQAGFTHCAANYDFTQTASFTDNVGTHTWSNLSTWFTCSTSTSGSLIMALSGGFITNIGCDTSHQNIVSDGGTQVFTLIYSPADQVAGSYGNNVHTGAGNTSIPYRPAYYLEEVVRGSTATNTCSSFCTSLNDTSTFSNVGSGTCFVSMDIELDAGPPAGNGGLPRWNCQEGNDGIGPAWSPAFSPLPATYETLGTLVTTDGANNFGGCNYQASGAISGLQVGAFLGCISLAGTPKAGQPTPSGANVYVYILSGPAASAWVSPWTLGSTWNLYMQRLTIWQCPNYASAQCYNNPIITSHP